MKRFPDILHISTHAISDECRVFRVDSPFRYFGKCEDTVQEGFLTDGASIPRWFWTIFSSTGKAFYGGVAHDHGYSRASKATDRKMVDLDLYDACRECGIGVMKASMIYRAVRMFGGRFWKKRPIEECFSPE